MATTTTITAENVNRLFPDVTRTRLVGAAEPVQNATITPSELSHQLSQDDSVDLSGYDAEQIRLMDETCIVLDQDDNPIGTASKKTCHLMTNISQGLLHRAFSCFLFHPTTHKLLLQQRASAKITFPDMWTNTCCSHPLAHASETGKGDVPSNVEGAKRAAQRKLAHELGIPTQQVPPEKYEFLTRIHYLAPSTGSDGKDATWGEHEIDYILFIEADPTLDVNENEVQDTRWVSPEELKQMFVDGEAGTGQDKGVKYTPWFRLICEGMLYEWWDALVQGRLGEYTGETRIRKMLLERG